MEPYAFETPEFGLDESGLKRLRSRFVFETIPYPQISEAVIRRGKSVQNWILLLLVGLLCLGFAAVTGYSLLLFFTSGRGGRIHVEEIATPVIPAFIGVAAVWQALQITDILVVRVGRRKLVFPLDKLIPAGNLAELRHYLSLRINHS